ncbi:I78 family peptidase inhibitor [Altererythrobacter lutimaris]|nr:I78 family peptidase inhibitor [Altererythrobacter lutimaris]
MDEMDTDRKFLCAADGVQSYVGQNADRETGMEILKASGARILRWGAPNSAWTMDYREDRVNVRYDRAMTITDITCG